MMKKIIPIILVLSLVLTSFSLGVFADGAIGGDSAETPIIPVPPSGGGQTQPKAIFEFSFDTVANTATVIGFSGDATEIAIPATALNPDDDLDYPVVAIGAGAFAGKEITSVTFHSGIESIGENAFSGCASLENVFGSATLKVVGQNAFYNTAWLGMQDEAVLTIGKALYSYTGAEEWAFVPSGMYSITAGAFAASEAMKYLVIPESVSVIGEGIVEDCAALETIFGAEGSAAEAFAEENGISFATIPALILKAAPEKTSYYQGETAIDVAGGQLLFLNENLQVEEIAMEASMITSFDTSVVTPSANVTVTYNGVSVQFQIEVLEKPGPAVGDVDGDGEVNDWDGILFAQYLAAWDVEISDLDALDIDADGEITDWDGVLLDRYLAGWDVVLG